MADVILLQIKYKKKLYEIPADLNTTAVHCSYLKPKIVVIPKKKVFTYIRSVIHYFSPKILVCSLRALKHKKLKLGYSRHNSMQLWLKVRVCIF